MTAGHDLNRFPQHQMTNRTFQLLGDLCGKVDVITTIYVVCCHFAVVIISHKVIITSYLSVWFVRRFEVPPKNLGTPNNLVPKLGIRHRFPQN